MGHQRVAIEHVHLILFAEAKHFLCGSVIVQTGIGINRQRQNIDIGIDASAQSISAA